MYYLHAMKCDYMARKWNGKDRDERTDHIEFEADDDLNPFDLDVMH